MHKTRQEISKSDFGFILIVMAIFSIRYILLMLATKLWVFQPVPLAFAYMYVKSNGQTSYLFVYKLNILLFHICNEFRKVFCTIKLLKWTHWSSVCTPTTRLATSRPRFSILYYANWEVPNEKNRTFGKSNPLPKIAHVV